MPPTPPPPGLLIVFEGIDGTGKSTHSRRLNDDLRAAGATVVWSREPTDGPWGRKIREAAQTRRLPLREELVAFTEDRRQHVAELIRPALEAGAIVILDRYFYSSIAYQGTRGADPDAVEQRMRAIAPTPDLTILIDLDPEAALRRITDGRGEGLTDFERLDTLTAVRETFHDLAARCSEMHVVDGNQPMETVHADIVALVREQVLTPRPAWAEVAERLSG